MVGETPDAIVVVSGASEFNEKKNRHEMGSFDDVDDSGLVAGGKDRVIAGVEMHAVYPESVLVTTSQNTNPNIPTYASIQKEALIRMGVPEERVIEEDQSYRTIDGLKNTLLVAQEKGWKKMVYLTSDYHVPRIQEFLARLTEFASDDQEKVRIQEIHQALQKGEFQVKVIGSGEILPFRSRHYEKYFETVKELPGYQKRVESEEKGVEDIRNGQYKYTVSQKNKSL